jgi:phage shock protein PspC (stress-responsive transcriptional regulator)
MKKVTTVSLKGNAYQLEETAYEAVRGYLERAERSLAGNPDRAEIMGDLEQAIGDKCDTFLGKHKNVVTCEEIAQVLREMGPVDGAEADDAGPADGVGAGTASSTGGFGAAAAAEGAARRKRLFRLPGEGMMGGVCAGLAAYFGVDVVWMRLAFVLLAIFTGVWFFVWLTLLIVMPPATSPEQIASARGEALNAREVMEMAKKKSAELGKAAASGLQDAGRNLRETFGGSR